MIDPTSLVGRVVEGRYRLTSFLGDGSFGWAFAAEELLFDDVVGYHALKLLRPKDDDGRAAIMREIKNMAQLSHARLVGYHAAGAITSGDLKGCIFLVMEMGEYSLADRLKRPERMSANETLLMARHVCEALVYLHERGAVHRDVKPGNVFRVGDGWKLGDFGLLRGVEGSVMAASGMKGTPLYLAPEAVQGQTGTSVDVWALGVMVHECLTGRFPYTADTEYALIAQLMSAEPQIAAGLSEPLDGFVRKALTKGRESRCSAAVGLAVLEGGGEKPAPDRLIAFCSQLDEVYFPAASASSPALPAGLRSLGKNAQGFDEVVNEKDGTVLICIPAGTFTMGSDKDEDEKPPHAVTLAGYWMAKTSVTNAQYRRFVQATGHKSAGDWEACVREWGDDCPVVEVSWHDAVAYCAWAGLRLPTEAEWEYAARGPQGLEYPWGNEWDATKCRNSVGGHWGSAEMPVSVGSYPGGASPFGCLDLAGNVWEWCSSLYLPYPYRADDGRERSATEDGDERVLRGGSWLSDGPFRFRGASRNGVNPTYCFIIRGFRSARTF